MKGKRLYTKGEVKNLIGRLRHPLYEKSWAFILIDGLLHGLIERNPPESMMKFMKYNLPRVMERLKRKRT